MTPRFNNAQAALTEANSLLCQASDILVQMAKAITIALEWQALPPNTTIILEETLREAANRGFIPHPKPSYDQLQRLVEQQEFLRRVNEPSENPDRADPDETRARKTAP